MDSMVFAMYRNKTFLQSFVPQTNAARCLTGTTVNFVCDKGNTALAVSSSLSHLGDKEVERGTILRCFSTRKESSCEQDTGGVWIIDLDWVGLSSILSNFIYLASDTVKILKSPQPEPANISGWGKPSFT